MLNFGAISFLYHQGCMLLVLADSALVI